MAYVDLTGSSGLGQFLLTTPMISRARALVTSLRLPAPSLIQRAIAKIAPLVTPSPSFAQRAIAKIVPLKAVPRKPAFLAPLVKMVKRAVAVPRKPTVLETLVAMPRKPTVLAPLVTMPLRPTLFKPAVTTAVRLAKTKIVKALPVTFKPTGIAPALVLPVRTPSGATYKSTDVEVRLGMDPRYAEIARNLSLEESDPIVPLTATREGITITDETEPTVPTFVEAAALEPSPFMKYGLLALGGYILYDTFVKSKPKKRRKRR